MTRHFADICTNTQAALTGFQFASMLGQSSSTTCHENFIILGTKQDLLFWNINEIKIDYSKAKVSTAIIYNSGIFGYKTAHQDSCILPNDIETATATNVILFEINDLVSLLKIYHLLEHSQIGLLNTIKIYYEMFYSLDKKLCLYSIKQTDNKPKYATKQLVQTKQGVIINFKKHVSWCETINIKDIKHINGNGTLHVYQKDNNRCPNVSMIKSLCEENSLVKLTREYCAKNNVVDCIYDIKHNIVELSGENSVF